MTARGGSVGRDTERLILCYHAVSAQWPADLAVTPEQMRAQLEWLVSRGYRGVTFSDAVTAPPSGPSVAITFDDAFDSVRRHAAPMMASLGLPGTVFVVTDFADSGRPLAWSGTDRWADGEYASELRGMTWPELRRLDQAGWEIGSHTLTHPCLTTLDDDALAHELQQSRAACERALGHQVAAIAYPYGDVDARVIRATAAAGYTTGAALPALMGKATALHWPRVGVYRPDSLSRFRVKASPLVRHIRTVFATAEGAARRWHERVGQPAPPAVS